MGSLIEDARQAGFNDDEISQWATAQRDTWKQAGFNDEEIGSYLTGMKQPGQIPQPLLKRFGFGGTVFGGAQTGGPINDSGTRLGSAMAEGAKAGFGEAHVGITPEDTSKLQDIGIFNKPGAPMGWNTGIRFANEAIMRPAYAATETMFRGVNAALSGIGAAFGQVQAEVTGANEAESARARRDNAQLVTIAALLAGAHSPVSRAGMAGDEMIGHLPRAQDFTDATRLVADGDVPPLARDKMVRMYEEHGIHPTEIAADAEKDPTIKSAILSANKDDLPYRGANDNSEPQGLASSLGAAATGPAMDWTPGGGAKTVQIGNTSIDYGIARDGKSGEIILVKTPEEFRNEGSARAAMETFIQEADKNQTTLFLNSDPMGKGVSKSKLDEFYTSLGFVKNMGRNKDFTSRAEFVRQPREAKPNDLGASAVGEDVGSEPIAPSPPSKLMDAVHGAVDTTFDIGKDIQKLVAPMATGTEDSMAIAKDFANSLRKNRYDWSRVDDDIKKNFDADQRKRMWDAADEESVARQLGESTEHQGLTTLTDAERAAVEQLQSRAQLALVKARDLKMYEGEGLPSYTPRMLINIAERGSGDGAIPLNGMGGNLKTTTAQLLGRKHLTAEETESAAKAKFGESATIARDIRSLPLATAKLEDAIAGRIMVDKIEEYGKRTGDETVVEGAIPAGSKHKWFTLDHPAFKTWKPKLAETAEGKFEPVRDAQGNIVFEQAPIYVRDDFEGPLKAVLSHKSGPLYTTMMDLKGKTMSLIMNSPLIHNAVEWGRALPAMPGKVATFKIYFEGNRAKHDMATMHEAIDNGLVPIGHRAFNQDISSIMEAPDLSPGRSWTAKVLGAVPGLFDEGAGNAVKAAIDKAGDFWHNTLLWDRVADLQMGLYTNFRDDLMAKGVDRQTAARAAAHWANRYAGALPNEAMSDGARKFANVLLFSRSFTLGNLGAMKDMFTGLPKDVLAQISRDAGPDALGSIKSVAQRKAVSIVMADMALMYIGNSILQSALNVMVGDKTAGEEAKGYATRLQAKLQEVKEHPLSLIQPMRLIEDLSATHDNEPGKQDRVLVGYGKDGTAIYARNPAGKIGEEFTGYLTGPLEMLRKKLGTVARPTWQILANDAGFGRKVYDPTADAPEKYIKNAALIAWHIVKSQTPEGQIKAASDLATGQGDAKINALQALGPIAGITFSRGAPGGPAVGELYRSQEEHRFAVDQALPDIRRQIQRGEIAEAAARMTDLGIPRGLQQFYIRTTINPASRLSSRTVKDFYLYSTPAQRNRFEQALGR